MASRSNSGRVYTTLQMCVNKLVAGYVSLASDSYLRRPTRISVWATKHLSFGTKFLETLIGQERLRSDVFA
jgi:hypothetical protein